jgi:hypothetical protein
MKNDQESLTLLKKPVNIPKKNTANIYTCHEFLLRTCKFEKTNSKTFLGRNSLLHDLVSLSDFLSTKFMKHNK